ncbi:MAG: hypothetical protein WBQ78_16915 [Gammaproteobacteria bacterium]
MAKTFRRPLRGSALVCLLIGTLSVANAYTPDNHERSVRKGAARLEADHGTAIEAAAIENMVEGVREPDKLSPALSQMAMQRVEPGSWGRQRDISTVRIASQSIHGSPNPTRPVYKNTAEDQAKKAKTIPTPASELMPDRLNLDVYSYDTNEGVRNRILVNASQFLCVSFAHENDAQSARKLGNMLHMIGDTFSASHVQRSEPEDSPDNCGTEKIEWHFSMDLIAWKLHAPADAVDDDWRFSCLVEHTSDLMKLWNGGRKAVRAETGAEAKRARSDEEVGKVLRLLCDRILREDTAVLARPAGGAAAGFSSASGTDNWRFYERKRKDRAIQPVGLTGPEEAQAFQIEVNNRLIELGGPERFWYPPRDWGDLCAAIGPEESLPPVLQCTAKEIEWAMSGSREVQGMWIVPRTQQQSGGGDAARVRGANGSDFSSARH